MDLHHPPPGPRPGVLAIYTSLRWYPPRDLDPQPCGCKPLALPLRQAGIWLQGQELNLRLTASKAVSRYQHRRPCNGSEGTARTCNALLNRQGDYQLSYLAVCAQRMMAFKEWETTNHPSVGVYYPLERPYLVAPGGTDPPSQR